MKNKNRLLIIATMLALSCHARAWREANVTVEFKDTDGAPITNATVTVQVSKGKLWGRGDRSDYNYIHGSTDAKGVASVDFQICGESFYWSVKTPSHYSQKFYAPSEHFKATVVESDYMHLNKKTADGLAKWNELKKLEDAGDEESLQEYYAKFEPKSVTYAENSVHRKVVFYPKRNPQPMISWDTYRWKILPTDATSIQTNGQTIAIYKPVFVDLESGYNCTFMRKSSMCQHADFALERYYVETNGVKNSYGRIVFDQGGGAYRRKQTGDRSFPAAYVADTNAVYVSSIEFHTIVDSVTGKILSQKRPIESDEYLVVRTRKATAANGVTGWHYSELIGPMDIDYRMDLETAAFNPRFNDTNIEFDPSLKY